MALLDTRDVELCLWQDGGAIRSPGFVLLDGSEYRFGEDALANARLRPRDVNNRYWWQLSTQPLKPSLGPARHSADLVHAHLRDLHTKAGAPQALALAVPDSMPREQLSLLLGIVQACEFKAVGLVSRSVLLASAAAVESHCLHLELQLHQGVLNEVGRENGEFRLLRSTPLPACGLLALQERCVSAIAGSFIQQTRFDPRRSAASEQALYNQLPDILSTLATRGECSVDIEGNRARVVASSMESVAERLREAIAKALNGRSVPVLVDPQLQRLASASTLPGDLVVLDEEALWQAYRHHEAVIHSEGSDLHLVDRLPATAASDRPAPDITSDIAEAPKPQVAVTPKESSPQAAPNHGAATHVLLGTRAMRLQGERVVLGGDYCLERTGQYWTLSGDGALVNGLPGSPGQVLALGDTLSLGSVGHGRLIEVLD